MSPNKNAEITGTAQVFRAQVHTTMYALGLALSVLSACGDDTGATEVDPTASSDPTNDTSSSTSTGESTSTTAVDTSTTAGETTTTTGDATATTDDTTTTTGDTTTTTGDTTTTTGDTSTTTGDPLILGRFTVQDFVNEEPAVDAPASFDDQMGFTDEDGRVMFEFETSAAFEVIIEPLSLLPIHFFGITGETSFAMGRTVPDEATLGGLGQALGVPYDPEKGLVTVLVREVVDGKLEFLAGTKVTTSAVNDAALVSDTVPPGYTPGDTTLGEGKPTDVAFVNVDPGPVPLSVEPPEGYSCRVFPGDAPQGSESVIAYAATVSTVSILCNPE